MNRREIESVEDIQEFVDAFYARVQKDALLGPIFEEVAQVDWETHLPRMYRFWETVLFNVASYKGNPVLKHVEVAQKTPLGKAHFDYWVTLFKKTIDERFEGRLAELAKERALMMSRILLYKCGQAV